MTWPFIDSAQRCHVRFQGIWQPKADESLAEENAVSPRGTIAANRFWCVEIQTKTKSALMKLGCTVAHVLGKEKTIDKVDTITLRLTRFTSTTPHSAGRPAGLRGGPGPSLWPC